MTLEIAVVAGLEASPLIGNQYAFSQMFKGLKEDPTGSEQMLQELSSLNVAKSRVK